MARPPVIPFTTIHGAEGGDWDSVRTTKGGCGVGEPPCQHFGFDAQGKEGTVVNAPCDGWVLVSTPVKGPPFTGYGPAVVLLAHDDRKSNDHGFDAMRYTLLGHLAPDSLRFDIPYSKAQSLLEASWDPPNFIASGRPTPGDAGAGAGGGPVDKGWVRIVDGTVARLGSTRLGEDIRFPEWAPYVNEGEWLGKIGNLNHTHWEVRIAPLAMPKIKRPDNTNTWGRIDPVGWLQSEDPLGEWQTKAKPSDITDVKKPGNPLGALLIGYAVWKILEDL